MVSTKYLYGHNRSVSCHNNAAQQITSKLRNVKQQIFLFTHMSLTQVRPVWAWHQALGWIQVCSTYLSFCLEHKDSWDMFFSWQCQKGKRSLTTKHMLCLFPSHVSLARWLSTKSRGGGPCSNHYQTKANHMAKLNMKMVGKCIPPHRD